MAKDFEVTIKLRNNQLKSRRKELGIGIVELCKRVHIAPQAYMDLESLKVSPVYEHEHLVGHARSPATMGWQKGDWRPVVLKLAAYFGCPPEELFPDSVRRVLKNTIVAEFDLAQLPQAAVAQASAMLPSPEDEYVAAETKQQLDAALATLPHRDATVLRLLYGLDGEEEHTHDEVAAKLSMSPQRVHQVVRRAVESLGNGITPASAALKEYVGTTMPASSWREAQRLDAHAAWLEDLWYGVQHTINMCGSDSLYAHELRIEATRLRADARGARNKAANIRAAHGFSARVTQPRPHILAALGTTEED